MNKFAAIINKTNFFYKLALEFTAVNPTAAPGTSQPIDQKQKDDLDLAMRYVDAIKQNIEAINKKYYPLISRDSKISGVISEISNYYQGIVAMQQQFQTNKNNEQFFNYMSNISSKVKDSLIRLYTSESIAAADPTAAQQLYSLAKQLNDSVAPFFKKLADNSKPTSTTTATDQDAEVAKLKTFLENFSPEQVPEFNKLKSNMSLLKTTPETAKSLTPQQQNLYKAYSSLTEENKKNLNDNFAKGIELYKNAPLTGVEGELKNKSNIINFQELLNNDDVLKQMIKIWSLKLPLQKDGVIGPETIKAINAAKYSLWLPYNASALQVYQSLKSQQ